MELLLLGALAKIGLGFIVVATLALFVLHAIENRTSVATESHSIRKPVDAAGFRLHHFPQVKHVEAGQQAEEPTQRAA
jgi:hypothetical protein